MCKFWITLKTAFKCLIFTFFLHNVSLFNPNPDQLSCSPRLAKNDTMSDYYIYFIATPLGQCRP